ncbi:hypothetical protein AAZV13_02G025400 [Glycine max]
MLGCLFRTSLILFLRPLIFIAALAEMDWSRRIRNNRNIGRRYGFILKGMIIL